MSTPANYDMKNANKFKRCLNVVITTVFATFIYEKQGKITVHLLIKYSSLIITSSKNRCISPGCPTRAKYALDRHGT